MSFETEPSTAPRSIAKLFELLSPAVVKVIVRNEQSRVIATGSGFIISWSGTRTCTFLTNYHVIRAGTFVDLEFHNGSGARSEAVLLDDPVLDLALLTTDVPKHVALPKQSAIDTSNVASPPIGSRVIVIGSPKGMTNTLSDGLISGYREEMGERTWVQITNPISPGSSGGPLLTKTGELVGVVTASISDAQNLNFAVPADALQKFLARPRSPRPVWRDSCIVCQGWEAYELHLKKVLKEFCSSRNDLRERDCEPGYYLVMSYVGIFFSPVQESFREFSYQQRRMNDVSAMILTGWLDTQTFMVESNYRAKMLEGVAILRQALPDSGEQQFFVHYAIGEALSSLVNDQDSFRAAATALQSALSANSTFAPALYAIASLYNDYGLQSDALAYANALVKVVPNSPDAHSLKGEILKILGSKLATIDELRIAIELNTRKPDVPESLGHLYAEIGKYEEAIKVFELARAKDIQESESAPTNRSHRFDRFIGWQYMYLKRYDEAIGALRRALSLVEKESMPERRLEIQKEIATCRALMSSRR